MKIGLFFGSFNPVHHGHLIIASHFAQNADLDQVWLIVSPQNPFKENHSLLNEYHRLHLVQLAIENENNLRVSNIEFKLPKPSFTIDTMQYLTEKYPQHEFAIIMGSDSLMNIEKWKNGEILMDRYELYIYMRPGFGERNDLKAKRVNYAKAPLLDISASYIRQLIKEKKSIKYLVPDTVKDYIEINNYYR